MSRPWEDIVAEKRATRTAKLEKQYGETTGLESRVMGVANVRDLTKLVESGDITSEAVILTYIAKAKEAHQKTNCLTEICFDEAIAQARELDAYQLKHGRLKGPLHGVPVSLKDQFNVKGLDSTLGYVGRSNSPAAADCLLVRTLKDLGAIIVAKTNLPQSILWGETENPLWGLTTHPLDPGFTPGGSSGGEAALLALGGSMIGWGTDFGGSIRMPSHMNNLWGFKPSSNRLSYEGVAVSQEGQQHIPSSVGPMAKSLETITTVVKAVIEAETWTLDPLLPPMPWNDAIFQNFSQKPLVIGLMLDDGMVRVHSPIERVFKETCRKLEAAGHELVQWDTSLNAECVPLMDEHYTVDGGEDIRRDVTAAGEPFIPHVQALINRAPAISVYEYWQLNKRKIAAQRAYNDMWNAARSPSGQPVDVLLVPTMPHTAVPHRTCRWIGYTKLFNLFDYTALTFPAGQASKDLDGELPAGYEPRNDIDRWNWEHYDIEKMDGHSVGLQIVGRRLEEEKVLGIAQQIQKLL